MFNKYSKCLLSNSKCLLSNPKCLNSWQSLFNLTIKQNYITNLTIVTGVSIDMVLIKRMIVVKCRGIMFYKLFDKLFIFFITVILKCTISKYCIDLNAVIYIPNN